MYYNETERISNILTILMVLIAIGGFIGSFFIGNSFAVYDVDIWGDVSETETTWGVASFMTMFITWIMTSISVFFIYVKKCKIEMLDDIARKLNNIEEQTKKAE